MKLYYDNKKCDEEVRHPSTSCRPRRDCDFDKDCDCDRDRDCDRKHRDCDCDCDRKHRDCDCDCDRRHRDCDCDCDERKCRCECVECEKCKDKHEFKHCCPKNPCPYSILFECTAGTGARVDRTIIPGHGGYNGTTNFFHPRSLGCLTLDTTCLKMPVVKFEFCSIIHYRSEQEQEVRPVRLVFGLFKTCDEGQEVPCGTWDFSIALSDDEELTTSFNFCHCECNSCPGCCKYTVKLIEAVNINEEDVLDVCNVTLSAIAKSGC